MTRAGDESVSNPAPPVTVAEAPKCPECGYDLRGSASSRCPECGWLIDARLLELLTRVGPIAASRRRRVLMIASSLGLAGLTGLGTQQLIRKSAFSWKDGFDLTAIAAALVAAAGMLALSALAAWAHLGGDLERARIRRALRLVAAVSMSLGGMAAVGSLWPSAPGLASTSVPNSGLEFVLRVMLFAMPGGMLFVLVSSFFESRTGRIERAEAIARVEDAPPDPGAPFVVQVFGRYRPAQVTHAWHDQPRRQTPEIEAMIAETWERKLAEARRNGTLLYDGELARLLQCRASAAALHLDIGPGRYRDFVGTNLHNAAKAAAYGDDCLGNPCGVSSNVITADGYVVLGRRNDRVAYHPGFLHPFGGALEADDREAHGFDIFSAARRELCEELHLHPAEIRDLVCIGLVRDRSILQPEFLFDAVLSLRLAELLVRFNADAAGQEHTRWESCYDLPEELMPFARNAAPVAPIGEAGLLLHGRHQWGMEWYETTCLLMYGEIPPELPHVNRA